MTHHIRSRSNRTGPGNNLRHNIVVLERLRDRWRRMRIEAELRPPLVVVRRGYWHLKQSTDRRVNLTSNSYSLPLTVLLLLVVLLLLIEFGAGQSSWHVRGRHSSRCQATAFICQGFRVDFVRQIGRHPSFVAIVKVDENEEDKEDSADDSVDLEDQHGAFKVIFLGKKKAANTFEKRLPCSLIKIPPKTAPQNLPKPVCIPCKKPCADGLSSGVVLCEMKEHMAAQTAACVMP